MNISNQYPVMIFASEFNGKRYYKVGLSKKDEEGNYIKGYKDVRFKKDVFIHNQTKIIIKNAWLDFYIKDKKTIDYIFISDFEEVKEEKKETATKYEPYEPVEVNNYFEPIEDKDLPF